MRHLVCLKQHGLGCDYTIGCGMRFDFIEADSTEDAIEKIVWPDGREERSALEGDFALKEILIVSTEYMNIVNVEMMTREIIALRTREAEGEKHKREIAELRRLKEKYERR